MTHSFVASFADFIQASPSSFHAAAEICRQLEQAGFERVDERVDAPTPPMGFIERDGAVVAWGQPTGTAADAPYRIIGTHTDSPGFVAKPETTFESHGYLQLGVEVYGGPLLNSWLDRELELTGRLVTRDARSHLVRTGPALRIPQLAIHLDREVNSGLTLDKQRHLQPIWGLADGSADVISALAEQAGVAASEVLGYDLITVDTQPPARFGAHQELFASARLDNLTSTFAALRATLACEAPAGHSSVFVAFNHEEIGSETRAGACGPLLEDVLARLGEARGASASAQRAALAKSWLLSADAGHAIHPNYPEKHDPNVQPVLGGGPLLKINANQRYATDAEGEAFWAGLCETAGVAWQPFVSNNDVPCGSTIGPLASTRLGIRTIDVGTPLLSMHSARELCHVDDVPALATALTAFFNGA